MIKIITTVGTSMFTNYQKPEVKTNLGRNYQSIEQPFQNISATHNGHEIPASEIYSRSHSAPIGLLKEIIADFWFEYPIQGTPNKVASAEISSILKIAAQESSPCEVHLIATDTLQSVLAAELIVDWFEKFPQTNISKVSFKRQDAVFDTQEDSNHVVKDLKLRSNQDYTKGFMNLIELLERINIKKDTRLNITGGFKGIIPVMTLFGQLFETPIYYLYEEDIREAEERHENENLILLGNLPFHLDLGYIENFVQYLENPDKLNLTDAIKMNEIGLLESNELPAKLSIIGKLVKNKLESEDLPFQKTTLGYFVEYKLFQYYSVNKLPGFSDPILGYKLSSQPESDLEDADLWFESSSGVIIAEIKPFNFIKKRKKIQEKIKKLIKLARGVTTKKIQEFWIILYILDADGYEVERFSANALQDEFLREYPDINFKVKTLHIEPNTIDGTRNRIRYHEFMRSRIENISVVYEKFLKNK